MSSTAQRHYDDLLAEHYDWMFGTPFEAKVAEQRALLCEIAGTALSDDLAVDLGCGSGFQTFALSELGYRVLAIDTSDKLLAKLAARIDTRSITIQLGDIRNLDEYLAPATVSLVSCMGDTLTHLSNRREVEALVQSAARALKPEGRLVLSYRDLAGSEFGGLDRFIPIRGDDGRVMTCFLEYISPEAVVVTDLIWVRNGGGHWVLHKSSYQKLRLPLAWVREQIESAGLTIVRQRTGGMATLAAVKMH